MVCCCDSHNWGVEKSNGKHGHDVEIQKELHGGQKGLEENESQEILHSSFFAK